MRQPDFNLLDWPVMLPDEEWHRETQVDQIPEVEWNVRSGDKLWKTLGAIQNQYRPYKGKFPFGIVGMKTKHLSFFRPLLDTISSVIS